MFGLAKIADLLPVLERLERLERRIEEPVEVSAPDLAPLESRITRLETENGKNHLEALALMEKVARRLDWRQRKRVDPEEEQVAVEKGSPPTDGDGNPPGVPPNTSHLARRFKGY